MGARRSGMLLNGDITDLIVTGFEVYPPVYPAREPITWEQYMAEPPLKRRYDIIDGVRVYGKFSSVDHQTVVGNLLSAWDEFNGRPRFGHVLFLPFEILITKEPFRTRQTDLAFVSKSRIQAACPIDDGAPIVAAPEIVAEVLEDDETIDDVADKLSDFARIGVDECWIVSLEQSSVQVLVLADRRYEITRTYSAGEVIQSVVCEQLTAKVVDVFAE